MKRLGWHIQAGALLLMRVVQLCIAALASGLFGLHQGVSLMFLSQNIRAQYLSDCECGLNCDCSCLGGLVLLRNCLSVQRPEDYLVDFRVCQDRLCSNPQVLLRDLDYRVHHRPNDLDIANPSDLATADAPEVKNRSSGHFPSGSTVSPLGPSTSVLCS